MVPEQETTAMSRCSAQSSLQHTQSEPSPDYHWKERSLTSSGIFARETVKANRRMQSQSPQRNSGGPREIQSEHRSGWSTLSSSVSMTGSMYQMTQSYVAASQLSTMTPEWQDIRGAGRHWNLSPATTGGHRCPVTLASMRRRVIPVSGPRFSNAAQPENSTHS
jgi:hypothetical protein